MRAIYEQGGIVANYVPHEREDAGCARRRVIGRVGVPPKKVEGYEWPGIISLSLTPSPLQSQVVVFPRGLLCRLRPVRSPTLPIAKNASDSAIYFYGEYLGDTAGSQNCYHTSAGPIEPHVLAFKPSKSDQASRRSRDPQFLYRRT